MPGGPFPDRTPGRGHLGQTDARHHELMGPLARARTMGAPSSDAPVSKNPGYVYDPSRILLVKTLGHFPIAL